MRDIIFQELRECNRVICKIEDATERESGNKLLVDSIEKICELSNIGRKEGLLSLEEAAGNIDDIENGHYLESMIMLIVDGTDPDIVEELSTARYFSANLTGYKALQYLVMMFGSLAIQAGENPRIIEEKMLVLIPEDVSEMYRKKREASKESKPSQVAELDILEQYYNGEIAARPGDEFYFQIKVADYAIRSLDDRSIQRVLRDVDNCDLELAMKGLSGEARRRLFYNLSRRLAVMIAENMEFMGPVRMKDVSAAIIKIFNIIMKLISCAEIVSTDGDALCLFCKIFDATEDDAKNLKREEAENELYNLMEEYNSSSHKIINAPWKNS
ncbi:MAG: FliG C-terminal domain-containing protein [Lachnospiraceae bacterium]